MPCTPVKLPGGVTALVCTRGRRGPAPLCKDCGRPASVFCDFPSTIKPGTTCDRPLCGSCSKSVGSNKDYCLRHPAPQDEAVATEFLERLP